MEEIEGQTGKEEKEKNERERERERVLKENSKIESKETEIRFVQNFLSNQHYIAQERNLFLKVNC